MSFAEILVVLLVALLVFGPERLSGFAYNIGRLLKKSQQLKMLAQQHLTQLMYEEQLQKNIKRAEAAEKNE